MRLVTFRTADGHHAVGRVAGAGAADDAVVEIDSAGVSDVGALLAIEGWQQAAASAHGRTYQLGDLDLAPVVPANVEIVPEFFATARILPRPDSEISSVPSSLVEMLVGLRRAACVAGPPSPMENGSLPATVSITDPAG